ncbi:MAG: acyl-CoA reductase [Salibacteraceae bacterium]
MTLSDRINAFSYLGNRVENFLSNRNSDSLDKDLLSLNEIVKSSSFSNGWFVENEVLRALKGTTSFLKKDKLESWTSNSAGEFDETSDAKVGIIMAGNIPLVGFHDLLSVLMSGCRAQVKLSSDDKHLIPALMQLLDEPYPELVEKVQFVERLEGFDAIIATGSNNSSRYFESYFSKVPHIIRKNRTSVAILSGQETQEELTKLGKDVFYYFGLGCRNVTKIYIPENFVLDRFFEAMLPFDYVMSHNKYMNNYSYNQTLLLMKSEAILDNNFLILKEDEGFHSPIGVLFYERYSDKSDLMNSLNENKDQIQCVVGNEVQYGKAQYPNLNDYADGIDTLSFLKGLKDSR